MEWGVRVSAPRPSPPSLPGVAMTWSVLVLALIPALALGAPQQEAAAVITVGGQSFSSWQAYVDSAVFKERGLRCLTRSEEPGLEQRPLSDCTLSSTTIRPEYAPHGHAIYRIPVVVHVIQTSTGQGQISDGLVESQIDVLNEDFRAIAGSLGQNGNDARIQFHLATEDPLGNPTTGITRTTNNTWFNDSGAYFENLAWDPSRYLNIYTNLASGALGYVPDLPQSGLVGSNADRVVILWSAFGRNAPIGSPYNLGRTVTHEVGHYLGLYHTFDFGCGSGACYTTGDRLCDTNSEANPVFGCPGSSTSCGTSDPYHNYMDYSDDPCMTQFTLEQVNRMRCTLANWRVDMGNPTSFGPKVVSRTGGFNLSAFSASSPVPGQLLQLRINAPGKGSAAVFASTAPAFRPFPNGMVQLVDERAGQLFSRSVALVDGRGTLAWRVPTDLALRGTTAYTQALVMGGGTGWALTNALDITIGR